MNKVDLSHYNNDWYSPGASGIKRILWYYTNSLFFKGYLFPFSGLKVFLLKLFGAKVGLGCNIKPNVNIKYPWKLVVGNHCWIGEDVWIDNLAQVELKDHVCISQGAYLLCGNHDFTKKHFDLIVKPIKIEDGAWIGAKSVVTPGLTIGSHAVLSAASMASSDLEPFFIYQGVPAVKIKERKIETKG